jgi:hypothetical protein
MVSLEAFSELLEVLYSAPLQQEQWERFLVLVSKHTESEYGAFLCASSFKTRPYLAQSSWKTFVAGMLGLGSASASSARRVSHSFRPASSRSKERRLARMTSSGWRTSQTRPALRPPAEARPNHRGVCFLLRPFVTFHSHSTAERLVALPC